MFDEDDAREFTLWTRMDVMVIPSASFRVILERLERIGVGTQRPFTK